MILLTGFPGFIGSALLPRLAQRTGEEIVCLVQERFLSLAGSRLLELEQHCPALRDRVRLLIGDITRPGLGLAAPLTLREVYHLAAVYDLEVPRKTGLLVNLEGTRNVLDAARASGALERFHYISTCYVSGRHPGDFSEDDLDVGQTFNNFYEETKFLAELEVQKAMREDCPATIYRPSVVVGDSTTGETQKFDGPYYVIRWILRQPALAVLPVVGNPRETYFNMVPRDFLIDALAWLSGLPESRGKVYHLADPHPLTVDAILREVSRVSGRTVLRVPLPLPLARAAIDHVPGVRRLMGIPSAAIDYFVHPTRYQTGHASKDLAASGITLPPAMSYLPKMVNFVRENPSVSSAAMA